MMDVGHPEIAGLVRRALEEDIGSGDDTSEACIPPDRTAEGDFLARGGKFVVPLPDVYLAPAASPSG